MTRDEILALSDEALNARAFETLPTMDGLYLGRDRMEYRNGRIIVNYNNGEERWWMPSMNIADAWELFVTVYNKKSPLYGGAWVLGTVDDGKDCSQATLFLHLPWRARFKKAMKTGEAAKVDKYQATEKPGRMARAITLVYVMAMEDAR